MEKSLSSLINELNRSDKVVTIEGVNFKGNKFTTKALQPDIMGDTVRFRLLRSARKMPFFVTDQVLLNNKALYLFTIKDGDKVLWNYQNKDNFILQIKKQYTLNYGVDSKDANVRKLKKTLLKPLQIENLSGDKQIIIPLYFDKINDDKYIANAGIVNKGNLNVGYVAVDLNDKISILDENSSIIETLNIDKGFEEKSL